MKPLVVFRAEPAASMTAARASAMGLKVRIIPLFEVVPVEWSAPNAGRFDGLVLTSANAVRHGGPQLAAFKGLPVHAVGAATAAAAREAGFTVASIGGGSSRDMDLPDDKTLLHLTGRDHVGTSAAETISVYAAQAIESPEGIDALAGSVVAVHSPRAGSRLAELVKSRARIAIAAISPAAASACGAGWEQVHAASMPNEETLLALAARLCESPPR